MRRRVNWGRVLWGCATVAAVVSLGGAVIVATSLTNAQQEALPSSDSPVAPVGVFMTSEDQLTLSGAAPEFAWTTRVYIDESGFSVAAGLARASDPYSSALGESIDYGIQEGELSAPVTVVFVLPSSEDPQPSSTISRELKDLLDAGSQFTPWDGANCASWTLPDGTKTTVAPTIDINSWRTRLICEIPAIGQFSDLSVGVAVRASESLQPAPLVGRAAVTVFKLTQPFLTPSDDVISKEVVPIDTARLVGIAYGGVVFEGPSSSGGVPGIYVATYDAGEFVPLVIVDEAARSAGLTTIQLMWVLVGLLGGWAGVAGYRAVTWTKAS